MSSRSAVLERLWIAGAMLALGMVGFLLIGATPVPAAGERFDFVATSGTLGFGQTHNVELRAEPGKPLLVRSTGRDPFFHSPAVSLRAAKRGVLVVRAAFEGPVRRLGLLFTTDKSPNFGQDKALTVPVRADGKEHEVRLPVGQHSMWQGTITHYRFDLEPNDIPGAMMRLASVVYEYPTEPALRRFVSSASVLSRNTTAILTVEIENRTPDVFSDIEVHFHSSTNTVSLSPSRVAVAGLAPDEQRNVQALARGERDGVVVLDAMLLRRGVELDRRNVALCVARDYPSGWEPRGYGEYFRPQGDPWAIIDTQSESLVVHLDNLSGLAEWWVWEGEGLVRAGRIFPLVSLLHGEHERQLEIVRWRYMPRGAKEARWPYGVRLVGDLGPPGQEVAVVDMKVARRGNPLAGIFVEVNLEAKRPIHLRAFTSPRLLVGDGAFGAERDEALFPGLEYLEKGERSSSKLDYHTDEYLRTVPHPKKITLPLIALTHGKQLLMLHWNDPQPQGDGVLAPSVGFASPNFVDGQNNHLIALFWPSVPDAVAENEWEARKPVLLDAGERLTLSYELDTWDAGPGHVTDILPVLLANVYRYWPPHGPEPPRDYDAERALCRTAYMDVVWREKERGWNHALPASGSQWAPFPYPFVLQFLEAERPEMTSGPERNRLNRIIEQAAARHWELAGGRPNAEDYYFVGEHTLGCVAAREAQTRSLIRQQRQDGSWGFRPADEKRAELGEKGQAEVGIVADSAIPILQYALMTGDREAEAAGLKALEHMKRYVIPRAAQVWEIPVHTPDIMGSARAATAYRLGFALTGKKEYLERREYWLTTGLPFVYFWGHPKWPYWQGATIPVFGATHFRAPNWEGLPVQWCGLVYAEEVLRRADSAANPVFTLGRRILTSAMWQQPTEGDYRGLLPDSYPFAAKQGNPPFINPEHILRALWVGRGFDFRVNSVVVPRGADRSVRVSALARISTAALAADNIVHTTLSAVRNVPFGVLICGVATSPENVVWQGKSVPNRAKLERNENGWRHLSDREWVLVNLIGTGKEEPLVVKLAGK